MKKLFVFVLGLVCLFASTSPASANVDIVDEPTYTKGTSNVWYANWSVPGGENSAHVQAKWTLHQGTATGPEIVPTGWQACVYNCGNYAYQSAGSGTVTSPTYSGLTSGQMYTMCVTLSRWSTTNFNWQDVDCFYGGTTMDNGLPELTEMSFGGAADYITNANTAQPITLRFEDQVSQPWPSNWLRITLKNSAGTAYHDPGMVYSSACSSGGVYQGPFSGWKRWDFSCTLNMQTYASGVGVALQDGPIELRAQTADFAIPNAQNWGGTTANQANVSAVLGPATLILDRVAPNVTAGADDTTPTPGQTVAFTGGGSDATSGMDATQWRWTFGDGGSSSSQSPSHAYAAAGSYTATLTGKDLAGWSDSATVNIVVASEGGGGGGSTAPANLTSPAITGTPLVGYAISCSTGSWSGSPSPTYSYSWLRDGVVIAGENQDSHLNAAADSGHQLSCRVTATNTAGSASKTSSAVSISTSTSPSPVVAPQSTVAPSVTGTAALGNTLTCAKGSWLGTAPITYTYAWLRNDSVITGQTAATHSVTMADTAKNLSCRVRAANSAGAAVALSAQRPVTGVAPKNIIRPKISGTAKVGKKLTCYKKSWTGSSPLTYKYRWLRNGKGINAATKSTYLIKKADRKKYLSCKVTARNSVGSASKVSLKTRRVR